MAPFFGPTRSEVLEILRGAYARQKMPITLGYGGPSWTIELVDGNFRLVPFGMDEEAADKAGEEAMARGESWMPEHRWTFMGPKEPVFESDDLDAFILFFETWPWLGGGEKIERMTEEVAEVRRGMREKSLGYERESRVRRRRDAVDQALERRRQRQARMTGEATEPGIEVPDWSEEPQPARPSGVPADAKWTPSENEWVVGEHDRHGELHGEVQYWLPDGNFRSTATLRHGACHGVARLYHETGEVSGIMPFVDGLLHGRRYWFVTDGATTDVLLKDGQTEQIRSIQADYIEGITRSFHYFDGYGAEIDEIGKPVPQRPAGVPDSAWWRGRRGEWWDLRVDINGDTPGGVTAYNIEGKRIWQQDD